MKNVKSRNLLIGGLIAVLCICIAGGIYIHQNRTALAAYRTEKVVGSRTQSIALKSGGNDVELTLADHTAGNQLKLNGYFSRTLLKRNQYFTQKKARMTFDFSDNQNQLLLKRQANQAQHTIKLTIPVATLQKLQKISIVSDGGDVRVKNQSQQQFATDFHSNGGQKHSKTNANMKQKAYVLQIKTNGGNITA